MAITRQYARPRPARRRPPAGVSARLILGYAAVVYAAFVAVLGYAIGFFAGAVVPKGIDQGPRSPWPPALMPAVWLRSQRSTPSQWGKTP
jgi:hypothetical protein